MTTRIRAQAGKFAAMAKAHRPASSRLCEWTPCVDAMVAYLPEGNMGRSDRGSPDSMRS